MNRIILIAFTIFGTTSLINAQDSKKALKNASKELAQYYQNPVDNAGKLETALEAVKLAFQDDLIKQDADSWIVKGEIYNSIGNAEGATKMVNPAYKYKTPNAGLEAAEAFKKAIELAIKKNQTKDAINGLMETEGVLSNAGIATWEDADYMGSYKNFNTYLEISKLIKSNGGKSRLDDAVMKNDVQYYTVVSGYYGKADENQLLPLLMELYTSGTDKSLVYEALFNIKSKSNEAEALKILQEARAKFPEESGLLFAEINYYLGKKQIDVLVDKLKLAIKKEPENISLYTTLGNVYDQLIIKEKEAGNEEKAKEYFNFAYDYYNQALAKNPKNFDALYSIGALYYNKAATYTPEINKLANDYSAAATKKYNALKAEMEGVFDQALPYFVKAEEIDGKDLNTLIALKEIYARKGMLDKSALYKEKIEMLSK